MSTDSPTQGVTLYLTKDTIQKLSDFAKITRRTKSHGAEHLILHGLANADYKAMAPQKVSAPKKATPKNTIVKQPTNDASRLKVKAPTTKKPANDAPKKTTTAAKKPRTRRPSAKQKAA